MIEMSTLSFSSSTTINFIESTLHVCYINRNYQWSIWSNPSILRLINEWMYLHLKYNYNYVCWVLLKCCSSVNRVCWENAMLVRSWANVGEKLEIKVFWKTPLKGLPKNLQNGFLNALKGFPERNLYFYQCQKLNWRLDMLASMGENPSMK